MLTKNEYVRIRQEYFGENVGEAKRGYQNYRLHVLKHNLNEWIDYMKPSMPYDCVTISSLACQACPVTVCTDYPAIKEEGNNPMNSYASATIAAPTTETQDQRKYLARRLDEVYATLRNPLEAKFGLIDDAAPASTAEFKERIAAGQFTFRDEKDIGRYFYWTDAIKWRDPAKKADQEGFDAARKELKAKKQAALDIIKIDEPKAGLDAIKALEAWTPTGAAN